MKKLILLTVAMLAMAAVGCGGSQARAEDEWAVVNTSSVFMRGEASYTSENVSQSRMGTPVQVLERTGYWVKIRTPEPYEGWVNKLTLAPYPADYRSCERYICIREHSFVYAEPSFEATRLSDILMSDIVRARKAQAGVSSAKAGSRKDSDASGWAAVQLWDGRGGWVPAADLTDFAEWMADGGALAAKACQTGTAGSGLAVSEIADRLVSTARLFLGAPYMWGGMSAGLFDCSGLVGFCYFMSGIQLPRDASQQIKCGIPVEFSDMQAGDLVFFGEKRVSHVALCTGPGRIIHSSQIVRENSLVKGEPDYYGRNILGIRRLIGNCSKKEIVKNSALYFAK
ncbi:MAG: C40 family peptidase [Bacteroidales bacterium]|nr:C40 family peptidase [Bacteroidales bacterium]